MNTFKKEKIKYNITKASNRKKLAEILDTAMEGGYISEEWFRKAVLEQEKDLGCNLLSEYLELDEPIPKSEPINIDNMSSQVDIENRKRAKKLKSGDFKKHSPLLYKLAMLAINENKE